MKKSNLITTLILLVCVAFSARASNTADVTTSTAGWYGYSINGAAPPTGWNSQTVAGGFNLAPWKLATSPRSRTQPGTTNCAGQYTLPSGTVVNMIWRDTMLEPKYDSAVFRIEVTLDPCAVIDTTQSLLEGWADDEMTIWVNGTCVGHWLNSGATASQPELPTTGAYNSAFFAALHGGTNVIAVRGNDRNPNLYYCVGFAMRAHIVYNDNNTAKLNVNACPGIQCEAAVIAGGLLVDQEDQNIGTFANLLKLGSCSTTEGIGSKRSTGGNYHGLDFYTNSTDRMVITNGGNVGIANTNPQSPLDVYKPSSGSLATSYAVNVLNTDVVTTNGTAYGVYSNANGSNSATNTTNCGGGFTAQGAIINTGAQGSGTGGTVAYGGYFASQGASLANVGVYGATTNASAAISYGVYGSVASGTHPSNCAGYFNGDIYTSAGNYVTSDEKLKTNVQDFKNALDMLKKLQPKTYDFRVEDFKDYMNLQDGNQVGIMAQNLQAVFPNLVREKETPALTDPATHAVINKDMKFLAVNYTGLVPVLVAGMKEMDTKVEALQKENADLRQQLNDICSSGCAALKGNASDPTSAGNALLQNVPNPFSQQTTIGFVINTGSTASMNINSLDGKVIKHLDITTKGTGSVSISSAEMAAGTYTYSLYVDGKVVDTKIMVISSAKD